MGGDALADAHLPRADVRTRRVAEIDPLVRAWRAAELA